MSRARRHYRKRALWLRGVAAAGISMGEISYVATPLAPLIGRGARSFRISGSRVVGDGGAAIGPGGAMTIENATLACDGAAVRRVAVFDAPLSGGVRAKVEKFTISRAGRVAGRATLPTDVLAEAVKRLTNKATELAGTAECSGRDFKIHLAGQGADCKVAMALRISPDLSYTNEATVDPTHADLSAALPAFGFEEHDGAMRLVGGGAAKSLGK